MEPSRSGDPHDNLIPWQIIKGKEWSHQEIGHAGPPSQRRVGRDTVGYYHERRMRIVMSVLGRGMSGPAAMRITEWQTSYRSRVRKSRRLPTPPG